jgi:uncharacterized protein YkwD
MRRRGQGVRLLLVAVALVLAAAPSAASRVPAGMDGLRERSLDLVNRTRHVAGRAPLVLDERLNEAAQAHADDMLKRGYFAHESPKGENVMDRYLAAGGSADRLVAENISLCRHCPVPANAGVVEELHRGWMNSPEHRANILSDGLSLYGFAIAEDKSGTRYAVQAFAGPGVPRGAGGTPKPIASMQQTDLVVRLINDERRKRGLAPIAADRGLVGAAGKVIPAGRLADVSLDHLDLLRTALPAGSPLRLFRMLAGSCGGCGDRATDADVRFFLGRWQGNARYRAILLDPRLIRLGMTIATNGQGRKIAVAVLGGMAR